MTRGQWLGLAALIPLLACDAILGVDLCNKLCSQDANCGDGYTCEGGRCASERCPASPADASVALSSSAAPVSSGAATSASAGSLSASSMSVASSASSAPMLDAGPPDAATVACVGVDAGTPCGAGLICAMGNCVAGCFINGVVEAAGVDPDNPCRRCDPAVSTTGWSNEPTTTACLDGNRCTTQDHCDGTGSCTAGNATCTGQTPMCNTNNGACSCTVSPSDSCAAGSSNQVCRSGACGCDTAADCAAGERCDANNRCAPCTTAAACGASCGNCRTLPMTLGEGSYYVCSGSTGTLAQACDVTACPAASADCNADDSDACEQDILTSEAHCGGCNVACSGSTACQNGMCDCNPESCPLTQTCQGQTCRCSMSGQCAAGYMCATNRCVR